MQSIPSQPHPAAPVARLTNRSMALALLLVGMTLPGCASFSNPVAQGIPVRHLPHELLAVPRNESKTIPLNLLRQKPPETYHLAAGDILGVWIDGLLGDKNQVMPVHIPEQGNLAPAMGYPVPVAEDGTVALPLVKPLSVQGKSVQEARDLIVRAYTVDKAILQPGQRILVTLMRPRHHRVLVIRQDSPGHQHGAGATAQTGRSVGVSFGQANGASQRRGMGFSIDLPAGENDVLSALANTGGLPGSDAVNELIILRGLAQDAMLKSALENPQGVNWTQLAGEKAVRIPLRYQPGETLPFRPEDVILHKGDIVFVEAREAEVYYTGGLLPPGEFVLPRDTDLDIVQAVARVGGSLVNGGVNPINLSGSFVQGGLGFPIPSLVSVVRRTPGGGQIPIRVDLNRALQDPAERLILKPGDIVILQEEPSQALVRYFTEKVNFSGFYQLWKSNLSAGVTNFNAP